MKYTIKSSSRKNKQKVATFSYKGKLRKVHFGDPQMKEYPFTKRGNNYCARSYGIKNKKGQPTRNNPLSPNYWSRKVLWFCKGKFSKK